jgi:formylglycine-generating enzyme required for sulfatase activity
MIIGQTVCFSVGVANQGMTLRLRLLLAFIGPLALAFAQVLIVHHAHAGGRVAMVLEAEDYLALYHSQVGIKRGNEIAEQLRARGFEVIFVANPTIATARSALQDFSAKVSGTDLSLAILIGHGAASGGQTFFLPTNAAIERSTDLLSRGLSIANIARFVSRAAIGGVCFIMTSPNFANPIEGVDMRPHFDVDVAKNVVAAFSNSAKIPVSQINAAAGLAANKFVDLLQKEPHANLRQLVDVCTSQQGSVYGAAATVDLAAPVTVTVDTRRKDELARQLKLENQLKLEKEAREKAEKEMREAEARANEAEDHARQAEAEAKVKANTQSSPDAKAQAPSAPVDKVAIAVPRAVKGPAASRAQEPFRDCAECPELISLPGGSFEMGNNADATQRPVHQVTVAPFALGRFAVTNGEWRLCVDALACTYQPPGDDDEPVHNLSWKDVQQYLAWLKRLAQRDYRLPTEAEWEYAARAGTTTKYWWGDNLVPGIANCKGCGEPYDPHRPTKIGSFASNPFGLYDMTGGVWQWVTDCWHPDYRGAPNDGSSWETPTCPERVLRGGSWMNDPTYLRTTSRNRYDFDVRYPANGFRVSRPQ